MYHAPKPAAPGRRRRWLPAVASLVLAACAAGQDPPPEAGAGPVPVALRLTLAGDTAPVLDAEGTGHIELARDGADEPVSLAFGNGALAMHELPPGSYEITRLGPLHCKGLDFEVAAAPRYLGSLEAELVRSRYHVALMSRPLAAPGDVATLAERAGTSAEAVDARPLEVSEIAPCALGPDGPVVTWEDLTLGEKVILGTSAAALCALAVAGGGFCSF